MNLFQLTFLLSSTLLVTAQSSQSSQSDQPSLSTLPECITTCLHNIIPECSTLQCYCLALNSTALISAASCYHTLCDSTQPQPFNIFMADVGPLCFEAQAPIQRLQIDSAASVESSSSFSTYLSLSDAPANATATGTGAPAEASTGPANASVTTSFAGAMSTAAGILPQVNSTSSGAGAVRGSGGNGELVIGMVLGAAGILLQVTG